MSSPAYSKLRVEAFPPEIIETIATFLEHKSLLSFSISSKNLHLKLRYALEAELFSSLKLCWGPECMLALRRISNMPQHARHVKRVVFQPNAHDDTRPLEAPEGPFGGTTDKGATSRASWIAEALSRMPRLKEIVIGAENLPEKRREAPPLSKGAPSVQTDVGKVEEVVAPVATCGIALFGNSKCASPCAKAADDARDDLRRMLSTISTALELMPSRGNAIAIGIHHVPDKRVDQWGCSTSLDRSYLACRVAPRLTKLKLWLSNAGGELALINNGVASFVESADIKSLEVNYTAPPINQLDPIQPNQINISHLPLQNLHHLVLRDLYAQKDVLASFFRTHADRLTRVSLIRCLAKDSPMGKDCSWEGVIRELQSMPNLQYLHLEKLEAEMTLPWCVSRRETVFNEDMTSRAVWRSADEILRGLVYLALTHRAFLAGEARVKWLKTGSGAVSRLQTGRGAWLLNLRYANLKAAKRYAWTEQELYGQRVISRVQGGGDTRRRLQPFDITDDQDIFPCPGYIPPPTESVHGRK